jgi:hypothetical protein
MEIHAGCGMLLQLSHEALSKYLVVDHVTLSTFDASSFSRKEKNRTPVRSGELRG